MIKVVFKCNKYAGYEDDRYTYADYENAQVGDIVVANTRYGFAIAKVVETGVRDERFNASNLATVYKVIKSADEIRQEISKIKRIEALKQKIKRNNILKRIEAAGVDEEDMALIKELNDNELDNFLEDL